MQTKAGVRSSFVNESVTPGVCHLQLPFLQNRTLALPPSFESVDTSQVRFLTMDDAAAALQRYEGIIREELQTPSELDRFCALPESKNFIAAQESHSESPFTVNHYESFRSVAKWYCKEYGLEEPSIIGVQMQDDDDTGPWSFIIMSYNFIWKEYPTWAAHFSSARQMAALVKALSECKKLHYPRLGHLQVNNVPQAFAEEYGVPHSLGYYSPAFVPVVRLPITATHPNRPDQANEWIGRGNFGSTTRA